jgi:hypothetical protein
MFFRDAENIVVDFRFAVDCRYSSTGNPPQNQDQPRKWDQRDWCVAWDRVS